VHATGREALILDLIFEGIAFPWSIGVILTHPAAVLAQGAFHRLLHTAPAIGSRKRFIVNSILADCRLRQLSTSV
jgi:hypothetical protein